MKLILSGRIPSKKNNRVASLLGITPAARMMIKKKLVRLTIFPSKSYALWLKVMKRNKDIESSSGKLIEKAEMHINIYAPDLRKSDLTNKAESIMDMLVDQKIIADDNWFVVPKLTLEFKGIDRENPRAEVFIMSSSDK